MKTPQSLENSIERDNCELNETIDKNENFLLKAAELELKIDKDTDIRNFKSEFMKEYLQYSTDKTSKDKKLSS